MNYLKNHTKLALGYFLIAAVFGVVLRSFHSIEIPVNYKFIVHTHSHIALLGWVYLGFTTLIYKLFVQSPLKDKKYRRIFWFTQLTLVGMLLTFPFQGYALFSIIFSTLFLFASYWFVWFFGKHANREFKKSNSYTLIKAALWYLVISSLGPWALGAIMNTLGPESIWYRLAIYFYLHFQYNGWMVLALFGLLFFVLEKNEIQISKKIFQNFFWSVNVGILLTFFLSTLWTKPPLLFNLLGGFGGVFQIWALLSLIGIVKNNRNKLLVIFSKFQFVLLKTVAVLIGIKMLLQLLTTLPYIADLAAKYIDFTIGYLHWTFLGVVSIGLFLFLEYFKLIRVSKKPYLAYLLGFALTEVLIFYKGIVAWQSLVLFDGYSEALALSCLLILASLIFLLFANLKKGAKN